MNKNYEVPSQMQDNLPDVSALYEASSALYKNGGLTVKGIERSINELENAGIKVTNDKINRWLEAGKKEINSITGEKVSLSQPQDSYIGTGTFEMNNTLIMDYTTSNTLDESPFNTMLPVRNADAISFQQDIMNTLYGYADGDNGVSGSANIVPLLQSSTNQYKGYYISEISQFNGDDLRKLRELGTSDTTRKGVIQKLSWQQVLLVHRMATGLELNRIEAIQKGSWVWNGYNQSSSVVIGSGLTNTITSLSQSLGSYNTTTNVFTLNPSLTADPVKEIGAWLNPILNTGLDFDSFIIDNISYGNIFRSPAIDTRTVYTSAVSSNNVQDVRQNLFRLNTIPALEGKSFLVDNRTFKLTPDRTTTLNTRPLLWGKTVTSSSFRITVLAKPKGLSRVGDMVFFPNVYNRNTNILGGGVSTNSFGGNNGIILATQDMATFDITNQKIQMFSASNSAPVVYLPNMIYSFDLGVTITS